MDNPTPTVEADGNNRTDTDNNKSMTKSKSSSSAALLKATEEVQDTLSYLSTNTQSLLRTMRLDVVVLETQRNEDMKCILNQLENQWDAIQHLLRIEEEKKREEAEREKLESEKKDENKNNKDNMGKNKRFNSCWANKSGHIDWDNKNDNIGNNNNKDDNTNTLQKQTSIRTRLNGGNAARKKRSGNNVHASLIVDNNFDWGGLDDDTKSGRTNSTDDILRALGVEGGGSSSQQQGGDDGARRASMGNGQHQHNMMNDDENDIPLFMRIFKRGESMPQQQQRGEGMQQRRWSLFGGNKDESCKSFDAPQQQQQDHQNQEDQPGPLQKFFASRRRSLDTSSVTGDTYETHPTQESPCTDNSSSSNNDNGSNNPAAAIIEEEDDEEEEEEDAELIQSLQVKLRGCDSAASTLHQLLTFQTRNLNDLKRQHTTLSTITSKFNATYTKSELEKLSNALQYAKVERRRKARQLEDAKNRKRKCDIQEERLGGELEGIRSELCRLRMEINKDEQPQQTALHPNQQQGQQQRNVRFGDDTTSGGGGHGHDRVVIVTTDSGRGGGNRNGSGQPQTQWKTKGIMKKKSANGVPDAS